MAEPHCVDERRERHDHVDPLPRRRQRHLQRGDQAGCAVGVVDSLRLGFAQFDDPRLRLHRHDASRRDVAWFTQPAPGHRADAAGAACHEPADRRRTFSGRVHPEFPPIRARFAVDIDHFTTRADPQHAGTLPLDRIECGHIQHYPAPQRHRLTVIAGAAATRGDRHLMADAGGDDTDYVCLIARADYSIGGALVKLPVQHRTVPEEVPRFLLHQSRLGRQRNIGEVTQQLFHSVSARFDRMQACRMPT